MKTILVFVEDLTPFIESFFEPEPSPEELLLRLEEFLDEGKLTAKEVRAMLRDRTRRSK